MDRRPKKMIHRGPEIIDAARRMTDLGVRTEGLRLDWAGLQRHKRSFTDPVPDKRGASFSDMGIATLHRAARFTGEDTLELDGEADRVRHIVIATGRAPRSLDIPGKELVTSSDAFLEVEALPRQVLFIGALARATESQFGASHRAGLGEGDQATCFTVP